MVNIIFLDIDGVMVTERGMRLNAFLGFPNLISYPEEIVTHYNLVHAEKCSSFDIESTMWIKTLINEFNAKIVFNSCWVGGRQSLVAGYPLKESLGMSNYDFLYYPSGNIDESTTRYGEFSFGKNPKEFPRSVAVHDYLNTHPEITSYIIIDDEPYEYKNENNLIICDSYDGITYKEYFKAVEFFNNQI